VNGLGGVMERSSCLDRSSACLFSLFRHLEFSKIGTNDLKVWGTICQVKSRWDMLSDEGVPEKEEA
jgi:hypothetical protein